MADTDYVIAGKEGATPVVQGTTVADGDGVFKTGAGGVKQGHKCELSNSSTEKDTVPVDTLNRISPLLITPSFAYSFYCLL